MFIGKWNKSVYLTYIGLAFAILGIYLASALGESHYALMCLMAAGICDMFDGKIARACKRNKEEIAFGIELDSLADLVCFAILPITIFISLGFTKWYNVISFILLAIAGVARLAYFNVVTATKDGKAVKYYEGLPITMAAAVFPIFYLLSYVLSETAFFIFFTILVYVEAFLNMYKFKLKKPTSKWAYIAASILALSTIITYVVLL